MAACLDIYTKSSRSVRPENGNYKVRTMFVNWDMMVLHVRYSEVVSTSSPIIFANNYIINQINPCDMSSHVRHSFIAPQVSTFTHLGLLLPSELFPMPCMPISISSACMVFLHVVFGLLYSTLYRTILYRTVPYCIIPYTIPCHVIPSCHAIPYSTIQYHRPTAKPIQYYGGRMFGGSCFPGSLIF